MSDFQEHLIAGAVLGGLSYLAVTNRQRQNSNVRDLLLCAASGAVAASVPDKLEPATSPHHRQLAHSWTAGLAGLSATSAIMQHPTELRQKILLAGIAGYLSHLALDATTPKSLPLL